MLLKLLAILPFALHGLGHPTFSPAENHTHAHDGNTPYPGLTDHQSSTQPKGMSFHLPEGMYECAGANWTPPCKWRPTGDYCMNATYPGEDYSWGPDHGLSCELFLTASCGATKKEPYMNAGQLGKAGNRFITPGISSFANSPSWRTAISGLYTGDEYEYLPAKSFHCKPTSAW